MRKQTRGWLAIAAKARTTAQLVTAYARLRNHLTGYTRIRVLDFDENAGREYDRLRGMKLRVGALDLRIASIVMSLDGALVTRNRVDFGKVPGLRIVDWSAP